MPGSLSHSFGYCSSDVPGLDVALPAPSVVLSPIRAMQAFSPFSPVWTSIGALSLYRNTSLNFAEHKGIRVFVSSNKNAFTLLTPDSRVYPASNPSVVIPLLFAVLLSEAETSISFPFSSYPATIIL